MDLFPAIDIRHGRVVRLSQGESARETVYEDDPVAQAERFVADGARWIHVVDLDAALTGRPVNRSVVAAVVEAVGKEARIQASGGVRSAVGIGSPPPRSRRPGSRGWPFTRNS